MRINYPQSLIFFHLMKDESPKLSHGQMNALKVNKTPP